MPPKEISGESAIQIGGLNASVMKPKPMKNTAKSTAMSSTGTGGPGGEDDPMGMIPKAGSEQGIGFMSALGVFGGEVVKPKTREVSIKGGQFPDEEPSFTECGTSMDDLPPLEDAGPVEVKKEKPNTEPVNQPDPFASIDDSAVKRM